MKITRHQLRQIIKETVEGDFASRHTHRNIMQNRAMMNSDDGTVELCPECSGTGDCPYCNDGYDSDGNECDQCGGGGSCSDCGGSGMLDEGHHIAEGRGNVQSEPEFGALLDAFQALEDKGFMACVEKIFSEYGDPDSDNAVGEYDMPAHRGHRGEDFARGT